MSKQKPSSAAKREDLLAGLDLGNAFPHGSNIYQKLRDPDVRSNETKWALIQEISLRYTEWRSRSSSLSGDSIPDFVRNATLLYQDYRDYLDDPRMDIFDSRGALQPSALEEFCYYLFRPLLAGYGFSIAVGHYEVYQGLYFTAENFAAFASIPRPQFPVGNLDFVIGKRIEIDLKTDKGNTSNAIYVPAVAVECKTYLDRPRYIESEILAANIKRGFPRCLYIVISEFLKLDLEKVNVYGSPIDKIYVFRREKNIDRSIRRSGEVRLAPLHVPAVMDFFQSVVDHLTKGWASPEDWTTTGILK